MIPLEATLGPEYQDAFAEVQRGERIIRDRQHKPISVEELQAALLARSLFHDQVEEWNYEPTKHYLEDGDDRMMLYLCILSFSEPEMPDSQEYFAGTDFLTNSPIKRKLQMQVEYKQ